MAISDERKAAVIEFVTKLLDDPSVTIQMSRSIKRTTQPGDVWETYAPGKGKRLRIEVPCGKGEYYDIREETL